MPTRRSFSVSAIHVDDLVNALLKVLWSGERLGREPEAGYGIYHVAADEICTYESLGLQIGALLGREPLRLRLPAPISYAAAFTSEWYARLSGRKLLFTRDKWREATAGHWVCHSDKLRQQLGWRPEYTLDERLEQTIQGYRQRCAL